MIGGNSPDWTLFGEGRSLPLDRKARIMTLARALTR
jgi:hypothetical protein